LAAALSYAGRFRRFSLPERKKRTLAQSQRGALTCWSRRVLPVLQSLRLPQNLILLQDSGLQASGSATWAILTNCGVGKVLQPLVLRFSRPAAVWKLDFREVLKGIAWEPDGVSSEPLIGGSTRGHQKGHGEAQQPRSGSAGTRTPFRALGPTDQTMALGSPRRCDPTPAPSQSVSAPRAAPA
jgi:hypothetical protein